MLISYTIFKKTNNKTKWCKNLLVHAQWITECTKTITPAKATIIAVTWHKIGLAIQSNSGESLDETTFPLTKSTIDGSTISSGFILSGPKGKHLYKGNSSSWEKRVKSKSEET